MKIKKGDQVEVIAGKDRGKRGTVSRVFPMREKIVVDGVNIGKRHKKAKTAGEKGERIELAVPIHVSNVMLIDPETGKPSRVAYRMNGTEKVRISKKSGKDLN